MNVFDRIAPGHSVSSEKGGVLRLSRVWKRYGPVVAVRDISFSARAGEVHALLGENGAGKSTLMGIASGVVRPDSGSVEIQGARIEHLTPSQAQGVGLAIVHQHPAVLPDLSVIENMLLAIPASFRPAGVRQQRDWVEHQLRRVGFTADPRIRMSEVNIAQRQLYELAKALAIDPQVLILDEPTAALSADLVELLFENVRMAAARGTAVVYISHRMQEIRQIAQSVTVMRDGEVRGEGTLKHMDDEEILHLIVGRTLSQTFPPKRKNVASAPKLLVEHLTGDDFYDVTMSVGEGEIIGIAGITGNGQSEFLRALAGLVPFTGTIALNGRALKLNSPTAARREGISYLSADRESEGRFSRLSVRENAALSALPILSAFGIVNRGRERAEVELQRQDLSIRTASIEAEISSLSGGNQQKVILSRALIANSSLVLAEEPTAGVDIGARSDIYRILRDLADRKTPVVIVSSDGLELEGLCDRVFVFSRGHVVGELSGAQVKEEEIGRLMVGATAHRRDGLLTKHRPTSGERNVGLRARSILGSDYGSSLVLAALIALTAAYVGFEDPRFLLAFNLQKILLLGAALAFIGFGQLCVVLTGGIDLSLGALVGLSVVLGSFFFGDGSKVIPLLLGLFAMALASALAGLVNGLLVRFVNFTAVAATLGMSIVLQGISLLLRPEPGGLIDSDVTAFVEASFAGIPVAFACAVVLAVGLEVALRRTRWGLSIRAVGSNQISAAKIGVRISLTSIGAFLAGSMLSLCGAIMVMAELGIGDANQGVEYTLGSVAAVVLGGASLFGGRGSFVGVLFGALLIQIVNSGSTFLGLSQAWQYWFVGLLTLGAVAVYSKARRS